MSKIKAEQFVRLWNEAVENRHGISWIAKTQLAIIETHMVMTAQVFLPYAITKDGSTVYEYIANNQNLLRGGE